MKLQLVTKQISYWEQSRLVFLVPNNPMVVWSFDLTFFNIPNYLYEYIWHSDADEFIASLTSKSISKYDNTNKINNIAIEEITRLYSEKIKNDYFFDDYSGVVSAFGFTIHPDKSAIVEYEWEKLTLPIELTVVDFVTRERRIAGTYNVVQDGFLFIWNRMSAVGNLRIKINIVTESYIDYHNSIYSDKIISSSDFWAMYEQEFLDGVWYYCDITGRYVAWKKASSIKFNGARLSSYHSNHSTVVVKCKSGSKMHFWIELERSEYIDFSSDEYKQLNADGWRCENDCSVAAEYISPVLSLDNIEESIEFIKSTAEPILNGSISHKCGWHIHVSVKWVKCEDLWNRCAPFMPLLWAIYPERATNNYSTRPTKQNPGRRDFVLKPEIGTVEFRIFPWCKGEDMLRFRLQLLNLIVSRAIEGDILSFSWALDFIMSSPEMFDKLSYVYNTNSKMEWICKRIVEAYASVDDTIPNDSSVEARIMKSLRDFVTTKFKKLLSSDITALDEQPIII